MAEYGLMFILSPIHISDLYPMLKQRNMAHLSVNFIY